MSPLVSCEGQGLEGDSWRRRQSVADMEAGTKEGRQRRQGPVNSLLSCSASFCLVTSQSEVLKRLDAVYVHHTFVPLHPHV